MHASPKNYTKNTNNYNSHWRVINHNYKLVMESIDREMKILMTSTQIIVYKKIISRVGKMINVAITCPI